MDNKMNKQEKQGKIKILIISPKPDQVFYLKTIPVETDAITFQAKVLQDEADITNQIKINWQLRLSWEATYKTYQTMLEKTGSLVKVKFTTGGILRIRAAVIVDGKEYSSRQKAQIIGLNPGKEQLFNELDSDLLRAQAFLESTWKQFDNKGWPLVNPGSSMRGLMQISERWWGEKSPLSLKDFNRIAWQWDYNIETAKLILKHYYQRLKKIYPAETEEKLWQRTLRAYKSGTSSFRSKAAPNKHEYVQAIIKITHKKPWEKL